MSCTDSRGICSCCTMARFSARPTIPPDAMADSTPTVPAARCRPSAQASESGSGLSCVRIRSRPRPRIPSRAARRSKGIGRTLARVPEGVKALRPWYKLTVRRLAWLLQLWVHVAWTAEPVPPGQLPNDVRPLHYQLELEVVPERPRFSGQVAIRLRLERARDRIWLHALHLDVTEVWVESAGKRLPATWEPATGSVAAV